MTGIGGRLNDGYKRIYFVNNEAAEKIGVKTRFSCVLMPKISYHFVKFFKQYYPF